MSAAAAIAERHIREQLAKINTGDERTAVRGSSGRDSGLQAEIDQLKSALTSSEGLRHQLEQPIPHSVEVIASYVIGGWREKANTAAAIGSAVVRGMAASPIAEVVVTLEGVGSKLVEAEEALKASGGLRERLQIDLNQLPRMIWKRIEGPDALSGELTSLFEPNDREEFVRLSDVRDLLAAIPVSSPRPTGDKG